VAAKITGGFLVAIGTVTLLDGATYYAQTVATNPGLLERFSNLESLAGLGFTVLGATVVGTNRIWGDVCFRVFKGALSSRYVPSHSPQTNDGVRPTTDK